MALRYSLILEAIDKMSAPVKQVAGSVTSLGQSAKGATRPVEAAARATSALGRSSTGTSDKVDQLNRKVNKTSRAIRLLRIAVRRPMSLVVRTKMDEGKALEWAQRSGKRVGQLLGLSIRGAMMAGGGLLAGAFSIGAFMQPIVRSVKKRIADLLKNSKPSRPKPLRSGRGFCSKSGKRAYSIG